MNDPYKIMGLSPDVDDDAEIKRRFRELYETLFRKFIASETKMDVKREIDDLQQTYRQIRNEDARFAFFILKETLSTLSQSCWVFRADQTYGTTQRELKQLLVRHLRRAPTAPAVLTQSIALDQQIHHGFVQFLIINKTIDIRTHANILARTADHPVTEQLNSLFQLHAAFALKMTEKDFAYYFNVPQEAAQALLPLIARHAEFIQQQSCALQQRKIDVSADSIFTCQQQFAALYKRLSAVYRRAQVVLQTRLFTQHEIEQCAISDIGGKIIQREDDVIVVSCPCAVVYYFYYERPYWAFFNLHTGSVHGSFPFSRAKAFVASLFGFK